MNPRKTSENFVREEPKNAKSLNLREELEETNLKGKPVKKNLKNQKNVNSKNTECHKNVLETELLLRGLIAIE